MNNSCNISVSSCNKWVNDVQFRSLKEMFSTWVRFLFVSNAITYRFRKWSKLCRWYYSDKLYWGGDLSHVKDNLSSKQQFLFLKNELPRSSHKRKRALLKNPYHKQSTQNLWTFNMNEYLRSLAVKAAHVIYTKKTTFTTWVGTYLKLSNHDAASISDFTVHTHVCALTYL